MKKIIILLIMVSFFVCGCGTNTEEKENVKEKEVVVEVIDSEDVKEIVDNYIDYPDVDIIDVRTEDEYNEGHIPGSINIPLKHLSEIHVSTEREIIVYCNSGFQSHEAAIQLMDLGYKKVKDMGGLNDWDYDLEVFDEEQFIGSIEGAFNGEKN